MRKSTQCFLYRMATVALFIAAFSILNFGIQGSLSLLGALALLPAAALATYKTFLLGMRPAVRAKARRALPVQLAVQPRRYASAMHVARQISWPGTPPAA